MSKTLPALAVAALAVAAVLTGCGGSGAQHTTVPTSSTTGDQVMKFVRCLRQHGVNVLDPAPGSDRITINLQGSTEAQIQAAQEACRKYRPEANPRDGADSDRMVSSHGACAGTASTWPTPSPASPPRAITRVRTNKRSSRPTRPASKGSGEPGG